MSYKEVDCCRLCSSEKNLMSLFSGKSRTMRDFLRKMIEGTVHIQVEQCDSVPLVCFDCSVDVSHFYYFKLHCLQNEKDLKNIQSPVHKSKRLKLQSLYLKDVKQPDMKATETVINWLKSKRVGLMDVSETSLDKDSQTIQTHSDGSDVTIQLDVVATFPKESQTTNPTLVAAGTQCNEIYPKLDVVATFPKESQTTNPTLVAAGTQCNEIYPKLDVVATFPKESQTTNPTLVAAGTQCNEIYPKKTTDSKSSQTTEPKNLECPNCTNNIPSNVLQKKNKSSCIQTKAISSEKPPQTHIKVVSCLSQTDNTFKPEVIKDSKDGYCQTDPKNLIDNISQTEKKKLTKNVPSPIIITKVCTHDASAQTNIVNLVDKESQCDSRNLNGIKNHMIQMKGRKVIKESGNNYKIADPHTFTDAILNGFDNIFVSTTTQTDITMSEGEQLNFTRYFDKKDVGYLLLSHTDVSTNVDTKLNVKIPYLEKLKEEKTSPSEGLLKTAMEIPESSMLSPQSSDLLEVNNSKTDSVKICKLCDKSLYSKKEVTMHNKTHMQCNICKMKFRSLKTTQAHINNCKVKQINLSPFVNLVRIDRLSEMRDEYSRALEHL